MTYTRIVARILTMAAWTLFILNETADTRGAPRATIGPDCRWQLMARLPFERYFAAAAIDPYTDTVYVYGGLDKNDEATKDLWSIDLDRPEPAVKRVFGISGIPSRWGHSGTYVPTYGVFWIAGTGDSPSAGGPTPGRPTSPPPTAPPTPPLLRRHDPARVVVPGFGGWLRRPSAHYMPPADLVEISRATDDVFLYNPRPQTGSRSWQTVSVRLLSPRQEHAAAVVPGPVPRLIVAGGRTSGTSDRALRTAWAWSIDGREDTGTGPRGYGQTLVVDEAAGDILAFGGRNERTVSAETLRWHADSGSPLLDRRLNATGPAARYSHAAVYDPAGSRMIVSGGRNDRGEVFSDTWALDLRKDDFRKDFTPIWYKLTDETGGRYGANMAVSPSKGVLRFGGRDAHGNVVDRLEHLVCTDDVPPTSTATPRVTQTTTSTSAATISATPALTRLPTSTVTPSVEPTETPNDTRHYLPFLDDHSVLIAPTPTIAPTKPPCLIEEREPNDTRAQAYERLALCRNAWVDGTLMNTGDPWDIYRIEPRARGAVTAEVYYADADIDLLLFDESGRFLAAATDTRTTYKRLDYEQDTGGDLFVGIRHTPGTAANLAVYRLRWSLGLELPVNGIEQPRKRRLLPSNGVTPS